jgi:hypothetical protein
MQTTLVMKKLLPVDLIAGKEEVNIVLASKENTCGKYRKVWLGNYKVLKYDTLKEGRESNRKEVQSYNSKTIEWLPELFLVSKDYRVILSEKLITVNEDADAVYEAAKAKLGAGMVDFFLSNKCFKDREEAWTEGVRLYLDYTKRCLKKGYMDKNRFNYYFNLGFKKHFPNGEDWYGLLTPQIIELCDLFEEEVLGDLHHGNIGISQFNGKFKLLDFGGN